MSQSNQENAGIAAPIAGGIDFLFLITFTLFSAMWPRAQALQEVKHGGESEGCNAQQVPSLIRASVSSSNGRKSLLYRRVSTRLSDENKPL